MESVSNPPHARVSDEWKTIVKPYQHADLRRSLLQALTSIAPYFILWYLMYRSLEVSYWLTLALAPLAAGFAMRMFIIFHDAGHGSFFKSKEANDFIGNFTGFLLFTPYFAWRHSHAVHHASAGDLDRRGTGDIWTLTVEEYNKMPFWKRMAYRIYRNPFFIFVVGPTIDFVVLQRFVSMNAAVTDRERRSVVMTNLVLLGIVVVASLTIGLKEYILVQLPIIAIASSVGVWLFYVQHQYENVYWERHEDWDFATAALHGSSFYKLPRILQWFSGNIGFHHIHHLSPRIPNYELERCHYDNEYFQQVEVMTLRSSLKSLRVRLYDEDRHKLIGYHHVPEEVAEQLELDEAPAR